MIQTEVSSLLAAYAERPNPLLMSRLIRRCRQIPVLDLVVENILTDSTAVVNTTKRQKVLGLNADLSSYSAEVFGKNLLPMPTRGATSRIHPDHAPPLQVKRFLVQFLGYFSSTLVLAISIATAVSETSQIC